MRNKPGVRQIEASRVSGLPWLAPPAGYVILIQDVAYGNRYKIARHQQLDRRMIRRGADFPFETRVALILKAVNAAAAERDLHDELAPGLPFGDWFDLQQFPPEQAQSARGQESVSLRDLARNDKEAESLLGEMQLVGASSQAPAPSVRRPARRRRPRVMRWALLLALVIVAAVLAGERGIDIQRVMNSILTPPPRTTSPAIVQPTTKPSGVAVPSATPARGIRLAQPVILLADRTETSLRFNWHKMPQAKSYEFRFRINDGAYSAWQTADGFSLKLEGLSPGARVIFRLRALGDGIYSRIAQISGRTLPAPTATSIPPTATATDLPPTATSIPPTATATDLPPTATDTATATATDLPPTATSIPPTATATDQPPTATSIPPTTTATDPPPTATSIPPTATATDLPPTATDTATATATDLPPTATSIPPTATATDPPPTVTSIPPTATATDPPPPATSVESAAPRYIVDTAGNRNANIRACPRTTCDILARFAPGTEVDVLGPVSGETVYGIDVWYEIKLDTGSAFIHSELAEISPQSQPGNLSASLQRFPRSSRKYTHSRVNVRTGPGTHYPLLDSMPTNSPLEIVGQSGDWYLVRLGGREGYLAGWLTHDAPLPVSSDALVSRTQNTTVNKPIGQDAVTVEVIDGDTIDVRLDGRIIRVRYIGVDTPERGEPCYAEATNYNRSLVQGKTLTLVRDTSDYGPYDRLLRYVYADGVFVNLALVQAGYAEASYYAPNGKHRHDFEAAQGSAPNRGCVADSTQSSPPQQPATPVDNCCFVNRHCQSDKEWQAGYYAYQWNSACVGDAPARTVQNKHPEQRNNQRSGSCQATYVKNCTQARSLGCSSIPRGHPAYQPKLDRDSDGIACE